MKVPTSLKKKHAAGHGSTGAGGKPATVGDQFAFGSTEEEYRVMVLGCEQRGRRGGRAFDHTTGQGYVAYQKGHYHDARKKGHTVIAFIVEAQGGITPAALAHMRHLARRSAGAGAADRTVYGSTRRSTRSFLTHHMQQVSKAAVMYDAMAIKKALTCKRQALCAAAYAAAGGSGA